MNPRRLLVPAASVLLALGAFAAVHAAQTQAPPNYLVISMYQPAAGTAFNEARAQVMEWVRIHRATGKYKSVRLFSHNWGPEIAFYLVSEPNDWASIPAGFAAVLQAKPDLLSQPSPWQGHSDNILTEILVN